MAGDPVTGLCWTSCPSQMWFPCPQSHRLHIISQVLDQGSQSQLIPSARVERRRHLKKQKWKKLVSALHLLGVRQGAHIVPDVLMEQPLARDRAGAAAQAAFPAVRFTPLPVTPRFSEHMACGDQAGRHLHQPLYISPSHPARQAHGITNGGSAGLSRLPRVTWMRGGQDPGPGLPHCEVDGMLPELEEAFW